MAIKITTDRFGDELAIALDEDPKLIAAINLHVMPDSILYATLEKYVTDEMGKRVIAVIRKYAWREEKQEGA